MTRMGALGWILCGSLLMSVIALVGAVTLALPERLREPFPPPHWQSQWFFRDPSSEWPEAL